MYFLIGTYGGAAPAVRGGEVLPLLAGRRPVHAGRGDRPVGGRGGHTFDFGGARRAARHRPPDAQRWLFLGFFIAFAIKAPFFPFHTWLPDAGGAAPAGRRGAARRRPGQGRHVRHPALLPAAVPGGVALLRAVRAGRWRVIGIIYAALLAIGQNDLKRLVVLHLDRALRLHRHRHLRLHHPGRHRRGALHGQPRPRDRPAVPGRRHAGRPRRLAADHRLRRRRQAGAGARRGVLPRRPGLAGAARHRRSSASSWC